MSLWSKAVLNHSVRRLLKGTVTRSTQHAGRALTSTNSWRRGQFAAGNNIIQQQRRSYAEDGSGCGSSKLLDSTPVKDAEEISHIAFGFMASKALFAALDIKLFENLAHTALTAPELADKMAIDVAKLETLTTSLCSIGLLIRDEDGKLSNPDAVEAFLAKTKPSHDFGDYLRLQIDKQMYPFMQHLGQRMTGTEQDMKFTNYEEWMNDADEARLYTESQHSGSIGPAKTLARSHGDILESCTNILDVGGGSGGFSITLAEQKEHLNIQILDFPNVCKVGQDFVARSKVGDRVSFLPGNALATEFPEGQCGVLMSYLSSSVSGDALEDLYRKAYNATRKGGFIFIHDFILEDTRDGPPLTALWALQHMVFTPGAISLTPSFVEEKLTAAGWNVKEISVVIPGMTKLAIGVKN